MDFLQAITYRGRTVAACSPTRVFLADELERMGEHDPQRRFVLFMCLYAGDIAHGALPGPYRDGDAQRFARACLIPGELLERADLDVDRAARALGVPAAELRAARQERTHGGPEGAPNAAIRFHRDPPRGTS